jgi:hypothetical protein
MLVSTILLATVGCNRELPVSRPEVIGSYRFERGHAERDPQPCITLNADGTYQAQGLHQRELAIPASGKWQLDGDPATTISAGLFTTISKDEKGVITIHLPEAENGYDCVKH